MPRQRFGNLDESKQKEILNAAFEEFAENGFEAASLNRIIEKASLSKGALYYYFEDKADLYFAVVEQAMHSMLDSFGEIPDLAGPEEFWTVLGGKISEYARQSVEDPRHMALLKSTAALLNQGTTHPMLRKIRDTWFEHMAAIGRKGQVVGAVRKDIPFDLLMAVIYGMDIGADMWAAENWDRVPDEQKISYGRTILEMIRRVAQP